jgi:hypothetical protein
MAKPKTEREALIEWLQNNDRFELLWSETNPLRHLRRCKAAVEALEVAIEESMALFREVARKFRSVGIGDTDTDEAIADSFYSAIH